jgi:hypothetical protein
MNLPRRGRRWIATSVGAGLLMAVSLSAQPANPDLQVGSAEGTDISSQAKKSPVELFRQLLAMTPAEQKEFLANRSPEHQNRILAKVREYESLRPNQRELRLRATELRWYLLPLLEAPSTNRPALLAAVPPDVRKLVEDRLREWDKLPPDARKELLDNEATLSYFTQIESSSEEQKQALLQNISPARRRKLEAGIAQWRALPEAHRRKMFDRFNQFFDLTPKEKEKALVTLSEAERQQMEKTLRRFNHLPPDHRAACIQAFARFTSMSLPERQQFLKNAEKWRFMSPDERQNWRDLVQMLTEVEMPPLPPGLTPSQPPLPPGAGTAARER